MEFTCCKDDLAKALQPLQKISAVKAVNPVMNGVYLSAANGMLELQANNFSTRLIAKIPANVAAEGEAVVPCADLTAFAAKFPDQTISFKATAYTLILQSGTTVLELKTFTPEDFPKVAQPEDTEQFQIRSAVLNSLIDKTIFAVAKDDSRPIFTGVDFSIADEKIRLGASNSQRLAIANGHLMAPCKESSFIVPAEGLRTLQSCLKGSEADDVITVNFSAKFFSVACNNYFLTLRLLEGVMPRLETVVPKSFVTKVLVDPAEFKALIDFVGIMARKDFYHTIQFNFSPEGTVTARAFSDDTGEAVKTIDCEITGEEVSIAFNSVYIQDGLKNFGAEKISIGLNDQYSPIKITEADSEDFVYVCTPVRTH